MKILLLSLLFIQADAAPTPQLKLESTVRGSTSTIQKVENKKQVEKAGLGKINIYKPIDKNIQQARKFANTSGEIVFPEISEPGMKEQASRYSIQHTIRAQNGSFKNRVRH